MANNRLSSAYRARGKAASGYKASLYDVENLGFEREASKAMYDFETEQRDTTIALIQEGIGLASDVYGGLKAKKEATAGRASVQEGMAKEAYKGETPWGKLGIDEKAAELSKFTPTPVKRSLGAYTAAEAGAIYFDNIVNENNMSQFHLIIHEVMGRNSGWLAAHTADSYYKNLEKKKNQLNDSKVLSFYKSERFHIHALYIPEKKINFNDELPRLEKIINRVGCLNIFVSEGAFTQEISDELKSESSSIDRDAFGHIKLDSIDTGKWLSKILLKKIKIDRVLIQKSGYFSRSSPPSQNDLDYIFKICDFAFNQAISGTSGLAAEDERTGKLSCISFNDIKGDKGLDIQSDWYKNLKVYNL